MRHPLWWRSSASCPTRLLPRRWVVERFFAWVNRNRRLAKDFEATIASATAVIHAACVMLLARLLARWG
jgi:putative transposase